ncbi:MAG: pyridoxal phosphate-dependent aminotransferase [Desulfovibrionaceae bacterium]
MTVLSKQISGYLDRASWIRKMFEAGTVLKAQYGEDAVCDFSLGNPDVPPPPAVAHGLRALADKAGDPFAIGYMANTGYPHARAALAGHVSREQGVAVDAGDLIITCGAAGGINALLRAILEPGDQVLGIAPFFVEYSFYTENHGGTFAFAQAKPLTFQIDFDALEAAITPGTRAVLINSPNNPSGAVYPAEDIAALGALLTRKSAANGRPIFLIADEPYRTLVYDDTAVPSILPHYPYGVVISSFSKSLSLAGERVGYVLLNPAMPDKQLLMNGLALTNRILGFVNAPAIGQSLMVAALDAQVDVSIYARRRDVMARVLDDAGFAYTMPKGAFYFFPEVPAKFQGDDVALCAALQEQKILAVPGRGFGCPGFFRLTFCVGEEVIERSAEGFKKAAA